MRNPVHFGIPVECRIGSGEALFLVFVLVTCVGCGDSAPESPATPPVARAAEYQRFQLVQQPYGYGLALDTKTGQICHTFNANLEKYTPPPKGTISGGELSLSRIPLCIDLSTNEEATVKRILEDNRKSDSQIIDKILDKATTK